jgi:hypothetical protein
MHLQESPKNQIELNPALQLLVNADCVHLLPRDQKDIKDYEVPQNQWV